MASQSPSPPDDEHPFAPYVRTLGRGPGRSRALTRDEARQALTMVLRGEADPHQVGAFLMLLRYRGEDPDEMAGLVEAARATLPSRPADRVVVDLDWPSYGAGRTRGEPWFLLAALALAASGRRILMHGSNEFSTGTSVAAGLDQLGLRPAASIAEAAVRVADQGFAYLPLSVLHPALDRLLGLRQVLGLRSPVNTAARLLDPFNAGAGIDGVFHPPYIALHLDTAARLDRPRLLVVKGGGGEAERNPLKPITTHSQRRGGEHGNGGRGELPLPPYPGEIDPAPAGLRAVWEGRAENSLGAATAKATLALALLALGEAGDAESADRLAETVWRQRRG